jgi:hypothetical protein
MIAQSDQNRSKGVRAMKKMLAMLILGATIALPAAAFAAEAGTDNRPDFPSTYQAPAVYLQTEPVNLGTVSGPGQNPTQINWIHGDRD